MHIHGWGGARWHALDGRPDQQRFGAAANTVRCVALEAHVPDQATVRSGVSCVSPCRAIEGDRGQREASGCVVRSSGEDAKLSCRSGC
jgi:hypothetical protein